MNTPYSKTCNPTVKKFYEDFDLLPREIKQELWAQSKMPTFDDLKAAWKLAQETITLDKMFNNLYVFEEERKAAKKAAADAKRAALKAEKQNARYKNRMERYAVYKTVRVHSPKDTRLIEAVSVEEAMRRLANRKENKDVVAAGPMIKRVFQGFKTEAEIKKEDIKPMKEVPLHICKQLHNG